MTHHLAQRFSETYPTNDLADRDARLLLDIGLVRAADGSLRLAADPAVAAVAEVREGGLQAVGRWVWLVGWLRASLGRRRFTPAPSPLVGEGYGGLAKRS